MAKTIVSIIPVELDEGVDAIITEDLTALTRENRAQLDNLKQIALATVKVRDDKMAQNRVAKDAIQNLLKSAADRILATGDTGLPASEVMSMVRPLITTAPAFTLRMKSYLKTGGNVHIIARVKDNYILKPFNYEEAGPDTDPS